MSDILITKTSPSPTRTLRIRNFDSLDIQLDSPVMIYALPESPDSKALGMKVEGNMSTVNLSWTLVDQTTSVIDELTGGSSILTADEQMEYLLRGGEGIDGFQPISIENAYTIKLLKSDNSTVFFTRTGIISKISVSKGGDTPITWVANIQFSTGEMVAAAEAPPETNQGN
jgi:hypothetical protein